MPHRYNERTKVFETSGRFCSWSCMKSFAIDKYGLSRGGIICGNMVLMRTKMFKQRGHIKPAPNRFKLKVFGGTMDIEDFRKNHTENLEVPNIIATKPKVDNTIPFISNTQKMNEIQNSTSGNNALKLKRNKPLKRNHNNLESALGLIITPKT
jgi:hypothetical protein